MLELRATSRVPRTNPGATAAEVRSEITGVSFDSVDDIAVLEGDTLAGIVPIERLMAAPGDTPIADIMDSDPPVVSPGADRESAAWAMARRRESSVAVVDGGGAFEGLVPPHVLVTALLAEHDEDIARIGGYLASTDRARQAVEEPVGRRLLHRLPWLVLGLLGAMASTGIIHAFEDDLQANILLAIFVPSVVYLADAVGTQTEALVIRGLSVGVPIRQVARRELASGLVIGLAVAAVFYPFATLVWGDSTVALAVSLALLASCSIATLVAMTLPWLFDRFGLDPAFGSGPLATVIQDLLSIAVYFAVAITLVGS